jgi:PAS domain S-box-containing protein
MWERVTASNALYGPAYGVGTNYLEKCDKARGPDSIEPRRAAAGIRSVLSGAQKSFSMQYPCDLPTGRHWFQLTTMPLATHHPRGAVIMHVDITDQKRSEAALRRFAAAMDSTNDALFLVDRSSMRYIHVNEAACRIQGQTRASLLASSPAQVLGVPEKELADTYDRLIQSGVDARPVEVLRHRSDGSNVCLELRRHAHRSGDSWTIVSTMRDVTDRKEAETRIVQLNRVHAMLSGINALIVRVRDRDELFSEACRIATDEGGFKMIWIGLVDPTRQKMIPAASVGASEEFLAEIRDKFTLLQGSALGNTMTARAVREAKPCVVNNLETSADVLYRTEHLAAGIRSMAVLPADHRRHRGRRSRLVRLRDLSSFTVAR